MMLLLPITFAASASPHRITAAILQVFCRLQLSIATLSHPTPTSLNYSRCLNRKLCSVASNHTGDNIVSIVSTPYMERRKE
ncbi:hypothetical protein B0J14DRAFT_572036, partial [Halenospora varia]